LVAAVALTVLSSANETPSTTSISVFEAQKTMEVCLAADRSAALGGVPVTLPLVVD